jgi:hypothetical protein
MKVISLSILMVAAFACVFFASDAADAQQIYVGPAGIYVRPYPLNAYPYGYPYNPRRAYRQAVRSSYYAAAAAAAIHAVPPAPYTYRSKRSLATQPSPDYGPTAGPRDFLHNPTSADSSRTPTPAPPQPGVVPHAPTSSTLKPMTSEPGTSTEAIPAPSSEPGPVEF